MGGLTEPLTTVRVLLLAKMREQDPRGVGVTKSQITRGLPERTQANHWRIIDELALAGYLERSGLLDTGQRWRLTERGHEAIRQAFVPDN